ncbi:hypothetical protein ACE7GA_18445 [Roseomonas sp. CCTCC AB2023176]|uniref:hypothetical protein n=1 Tax=Roseomonas sp. CCTCC AB2023176 TaxID=3342640 RepID=UPI0035E1A4B0
MSRVAATRPGPRPAKRPSAKAPSPRGGGGAPPGRFGFLRPGPLARRWIAVLVILFAVLVGLPIIAAVFGEVWALILGATLGGFALGRATAR